MPLYTTKCTVCDHCQDIVRTVARRDADLPEHCGAPMERAITAPMVAADIQPYRATAVDVATGRAPVINSRSDHRAFLKRNGYIEVGNEMGFGRRPGEVRGDFNARAELTEATRQALEKNR